jgi:hypothetical protein
MKAKVTFSIDNKTYQKGEELPQDVAAKYPNLVEAETKAAPKEVEKKEAAHTPKAERTHTKKKVSE